MTGFIVSTRLLCIEKRSKKVKSKRKGTNLEAMAISRQKMMVTWTRVEAKETVRSLLLLDIFRGRIIRI